MRGGTRGEDDPARRGSETHVKTGCIALIAAALGCAPEPPTETAAQGIIHGTAARDAPWAVMVVQQPAGATRVKLCTGTVVAPRVVLTAKHCVFLDDGDGTWAAVPAGDLTVRTGDDLRAATRTVRVTEVRTTDGPYRDGDGRNGGDIAAMLTAEDLGIAPRELSRAPVATGEALRIVGYGYSLVSGATSADLGVKREGAAAVARVEDNVFSTTGAQWTCTGDSGGPALDAQGRVVGVTSIGPTGCAVSTSYYTRVDRYASLFEDLLPAGSIPDAGTVPDAGTASVTDAGTARDGGATTAVDAGGCRVTPRGAGCGGLGALPALALAAAVRRRRRDVNGIDIRAVGRRRAAG